MVWGMSLPSSFGEFWPDGEFELDRKSKESGWGDRLSAYYRTQMPEEKKALFGDGRGNGPGNYSYYVSEKLKRELGKGLSPDMPPFSPVEAHEPPRTFDTIKTYASLGSLIELNDRLIAVDDVLKTIIERLEPGVHGFFTLQVTIPSDKTFRKAYHTIVINQYIDSFSSAKSDPLSWEREGDYYCRHEERKADMAGLAFSKVIFGGAHLWRERRFYSRLISFSDELRAAIVQAELRIPKHYRMREV